MKRNRSRSSIAFSLSRFLTFYHRPAARSGSRSPGLPRSFLPWSVPNPATDQVSFTTSDRNHSPLTITFYDIGGKDVCNREIHKGQTMVTFTTAYRKPGMYLYIIRNSNRIITGRICVLSYLE